MIKITAVVLVMAALLSAGAVFAGQKGDKSCCAKNVANEQQASCANLTMAELNLKADQKTKLENWQAECCKAGCTKESHAKFLSKAKGILSAEQYATLEAQCDKSKAAKKTQT
jgi:hypothetical protein